MHRYSSSFSILSPVCGATQSTGGGHKGPPRRGRANLYSARSSPAAKRAASDRRTRRARILSRGTNHAEWYGCALGKRPQVPPGRGDRDRTTPRMHRPGGATSHSGGSDPPESHPESPAARQDQILSRTDGRATPCPNASRERPPGGSFLTRGAPAAAVQNFCARAPARTRHQRWALLRGAGRARGLRESPPPQVEARDHGEDAEARVVGVV